MNVLSVEKSVVPTMSREAIMLSFVKKKAADRAEKHLGCSFCGKSKDKVDKLISGPNVYICNECVTLCNKILAEEAAHDA